MDLDIQYLLFLQNIRNSLGGVFNEFFAFITNAAVSYYIILIPLIIYWAVDKKKGIGIYLSLGFGQLINAFLKSTFCIYRPWIRSKEIKPLEAALPQATGYSFPSGHSTCASSTYLSVSAHYKKYKKLRIFCIVMVALTMFSRNFVGVHTPQDVIVGCLIGIFTTYAISKLEEYIDSHPDKDWIVLVVSIVLTTAVLLYVGLKSYPETYVDGKLLVDPQSMKINSFKDPGSFIGVVIAWFIERRFIKLDISGTTYQKVMRVIIGALLTVFVLTVLSAIGKLINTNIGYLVTNILVPIILIDIYPLTWKKKK